MKLQGGTIEQILQKGLERYQAGRLGEAEALYRQVLAEEPEHPDALHLLGIVAGVSGRPDVAVELIERAIKVMPGAAVYHANIGDFYRRLGKLDQAIAALRRAIELDPVSTAAHNNLGIALKEAGRTEEAVAALKEALRLNPNLAEANCNLGDIYEAKGMLEEAIAAQRRALAVNPNYDMAYNNLGSALSAQGKHHEAMAAWSRAIELNPSMAHAHMNMGITQLLLGDFEAGWANFEWRWKDRQLLGERRLPGKKWEGEPLEGRRILVYAEQGFGDTLQFVRYVPMVMARGGKVILEVQPELVRLLKEFAGPELVMAVGERLPEFDVHVPLLNLPRIFGTNLGTIPGRTPYLQAPAALVAAWGKKLGPRGENLRVGICWAGRPSHKNNRNRSVRLGDMGVFARASGVEFYSLQKGEAAAQAAVPPAGMKLIDPSAEVADFADTAGIIAHLDMLVTIDTAVAHLAGGMNKPVWVMLPFAADWRWLLDREDTPWYPRMRLFRQRRADNRPEMIGRVADLLAESVEELKESSRQ